MKLFVATVFANKLHVIYNTNLLPNLLIYKRNSVGLHKGT